MKKKSVQLKNPCKSLSVRQTGAIQTMYTIVKAHGGELKVETKRGEGSEFLITLPV
jgi:signal transduction histidine kinase